MSRKPTFRDVIARACDEAIIQTNGHSFIAERGEKILREFVEQREAKLVAALRNVGNLFRAYAKEDGLMGSWATLNPEVARRLLAQIEAVLGPNPPDYVPAEQLRAVEAKLRAVQAAVDLLDARESMTAEMVCAYLEAAGLKRPPPKRLVQTSTPASRSPVVEAWLEEVAPRRRPFSRSYAGACPHCNDLPYDGASLACPECGINRHGVGHGAG